MRRLSIDGIDIELDDDVDPADLDKGAVSRKDDEVDLEAIYAQAEADADREDDQAEPFDDDGEDLA